jgi:hypothetical protein
MSMLPMAFEHRHQVPERRRRKSSRTLTRRKPTGVFIHEFAITTKTPEIMTENATITPAARGDNIWHHWSGGR